MANLVIDIGSTALKAAWAEGTTLGKTFRYQGERVVDFILSLVENVKPDITVISTVRDIPSRDRLVLEKECGRLLVLDNDSGAVSRKFALPEGISPDRAASVGAARHLFKGKPCTVFDFGTLLTIDMIGADGRYEGGNISPGCRTRFKSINRYSKGMPLLDTPDAVEELGSTLYSSIASGVVKGIMFEIDGYLRQNPRNIVVFTGGDAIYFAKKMKNAIFVACNLVLMGLALIADEYDKSFD